jgi:hypothetical protein
MLSDDKRIRIRRVHMEEDTGKLLHQDLGSRAVVSSISTAQAFRLLKLSPNQILRTRIRSKHIYKNFNKSSAA